MPADETRTFGYHRAGVLAAFVNALTLMLLSVWLLYESWGRLLHPRPGRTTALCSVVALGAVVLNGGVMMGLQRSGDKSVNLRGAFIHMLGDLLGADAIIVGSLVIHFTGWTTADPVLSVIISMLIIWTALGYYARVAQHSARRQAARHGNQRVTSAHPRSGGRAGRSRSAYLEPRLESHALAATC